MKVLLIDPPFEKFMGFKKYYIPLGLLYIAAELRNKGHSVWVYDADYNPDGKALGFVERLDYHSLYVEGLENKNHPVWLEIDEVFNQVKPDIVGISLISPKLASGLEIARRYKQMGAKKIICGGAHASIKPKEVLESPYVDNVVVGEGEYVFEHALKRTITTSERINDLDRLSYPARDRLYNLFSYNPKDLGMVISSRGCPFNCSFCCSEALWKRKTTFRTINDTVNEIAFVKKEFGTTEFYIVDDNFTCNKKRTLKFCESIKNLNITWSCLTRADLINDEVVSAMKESGCSQVKIGLESGSEKILEVMNKRVKKEDVMKASSILKGFNLFWSAYFMVNAPSENKTDMEETINFIREVKPNYISFEIFTPLPGTLLYEKLALKNIPYHLYSARSKFNNFGELSLADIRGAADFADKYNKGCN